MSELFSFFAALLLLLLLLGSFTAFGADAPVVGGALLVAPLAAGGAIFTKPFRVSRVKSKLDTLRKEIAEMRGERNSLSSIEWQEQRRLEALIKGAEEEKGELQKELARLISKGEQQRPRKFAPRQQSNGGRRHRNTYR